jgi:3-hydroxy-D-aspartate aldolase
MRRSEVPTPALLVDIDILDRNIAIMRDWSKSTGVKLRPHAKAHKCVEVGQRIMAAGALGISCATIGEAEVMALGGITGILITAPMVAADAVQRVRRLLLRGHHLAIVTDHPESVKLLADVAAGSGRKIDVLVDVDVGMGRTGCHDIPDAVALAKQVKASPSLNYAGIQAYWGNLQHVTPFAERAQRIGVQIQRVKATIDAPANLFTEIQPGSYLFMDSAYRAISISENDNPFQPSLFVAASVVSVNTPGRVVVNAGWKAFAADSGKPAALRGAPAGAEYRFMGDEHGALDFPGDAAKPKLGAIIEFLTSHCDPTVNLYGAFHVVRGDEVIDIWPIRARY